MIVRRPTPKQSQNHTSSYHDGRDPLAELLARLDGVRPSGSSGQQYDARCPAHEDGKQSLRVGVGGDGRVLVNCRAGCETRAVVAAVGLALADLFAARDGGRARSCTSARTSTSTSRVEMCAAPVATAAPAEWSHLLARITEPWLTRRTVPGLADELRLPSWSLDCLPIGVLLSQPHGIDSPCWVLPECGGDGAITGLLCRYPARAGGEKLSHPGSRRGLTLPTGWRERALAAGVLYLPEGASDTLTLHACGLAAVGRASCSDGAKHLPRLLHDLPESVALVVVADRDEHEAGLRGAQGLARVLAEALRRPVRVVLPPGGSKDVRGLYHALAERRGLDPRAATVEQCAEIGREVVAAVEGMAAVVEPATAAVAATAPVASEPEVHDALPLLTPAAAPGPDDGDSHEHDGRRCHRCWQYLYLASRIDPRRREPTWVPNFSFACAACAPQRKAELTAALTAHFRAAAGPIHRANIEPHNWDAVRKAVKRAGGQAVRIMTSGVTCTVYATVPFSGSAALDLGPALVALAETVQAIPLRKRPVSATRGWPLARKKKPSGDWTVLGTSGPRPYEAKLILEHHGVPYTDRTRAGYGSLDYRYPETMEAAQIDVIDRVMSDRHEAARALQEIAIQSLSVFDLLAEPHSPNSDTHPGGRHDDATRDPPPRRKTG